MSDRTAPQGDQGQELAECPEWCLANAHPFKPIGNTNMLMRTHSRRVFSNARRWGVIQQSDLITHTGEHIRSEFRWMRGDTVLAWSEDEYRAKVEQIRADVAQSLTHLPCLPGCVEDHVAQWLSSEVCECWVPPAPVALVESAIEGREVAVMAGACMTYGASPSTLIYVGLSSSDTEDHAELTSEKARRLAAALIAAADEADAIVADVEG